MKGTVSYSEAGGGWRGVGYGGVLGERELLAASCWMDHKDCVVCQSSVFSGDHNKKQIHVVQGLMPCVCHLFSSGSRHRH